MSLGQHQTVCAGQEPSCESHYMYTTCYTTCTLHVTLHVHYVLHYMLYYMLYYMYMHLQVADEVGELLVHCRYGCRATQSPGTYEVDPNGADIHCTLISTGVSMCLYILHAMWRHVYANSSTLKVIQCTHLHIPNTYTIPNTHI